MSAKKSYTEREKILLATLVREHGACIENKKTDGTSIQKKQKAWEMVAQMFNVQPEANAARYAKQLKKLWDNLKQRKRQEVTAEKHYQILTGGGPHLEIAQDSVLQLVDVAAPHVEVDVACPWDSTANYTNKRTSSTQVSDAPSASATTTSLGGWHVPAGGLITGYVSTPTGRFSSESTGEGSSTITTAADGCSTPAAAELSDTPTLVPVRDATRPKNNKKGETPLKDERYYRALKAKQGIEQQDLLHKKRMEAAEDEAKLAKMKCEMFMRQNNITEENGKIMYPI